MRRARACRLAHTLDKVESLEKQFQGGDSGERRSLSRGAKVDPHVVLGLAEQRVERLLSKFAADRTVRALARRRGSCLVAIAVVCNMPQKNNLEEGNSLLSSPPLQTVQSM